MMLTIEEFNELEMVSRPASAQPRHQRSFSPVHVNRARTPSPLRGDLHPEPLHVQNISDQKPTQSPQRPHPANLRDVVIDPYYEEGYLRFGDVDQTRLDRETKTDFLSMSFYTAFLHSLICIGLTPDVITTLKTNYLTRVYGYDQKKKRFNILYLLSSMTVMIGSIVTSLTLTIQGIPNDNQTDWSNIIWWLSLVISVTVSIFTSINRIFALDRNFFINKNTYDALVAEGNDFLALSNKYRNYWKEPRPHYTAVPFFLENINNIIKQSNQVQQTGRPAGDGTTLPTAVQSPSFRNSRRQQ